MGEPPGGVLKRLTQRGRMDNRIITKVADYICNIRALGFNAFRWIDVQATTGELTAADKKFLTNALINAGATLSGVTFHLTELDVDILHATPANDVKLVTVMSKVPAGTWGKDKDGKVRFVPDPNFVLSDYDVNPDNVQDEDDGDPFEPKRKGIDLGF